MAGFSLYPRKRKCGKPVFYVQFKKPDGSYGTAKSTGQSRRKAAIAWAEEHIRKHGTPMPGQNITLEHYSRNFFSWDGRWALDKRASGKRLSERHCLDTSDLMRLHILPALGGYSLTEISKPVLKQFRNELFSRGKSSSAINKCLYAIKAILEQAEEDDLIHGVPKIPPVAKKQKKKGILTIEEVTRLFSFPWQSPESKYRQSKPLHKAYIGNLLAASTGLRLSELQALRIGDLHLEEGFITVSRSWDSRINRLNETTKTGRARNIFVPQKVIDALKDLLQKHPSPDKHDYFLFWGDKKPTEKPAEKIVFTRALYQALASIGIDAGQRKQRNITFHSWRHFLNSLLINNKIPIQKIQSITGHTTSQMTSHYYHPDDMADVLDVQNTLFFHVPCQ